MKKDIFRSLVWILLTLASIASYTYLQSDQVAEEVELATNPDLLDDEATDKARESAPLLPEVAAVKKAIDLGRTILKSRD